MNVNVTLAYRYLWGRKLRTALTTLSIVFGVMLLFGLNGVMPAVMQSMQQSMLAAGGETDVTVSLKSGGTFEPDVLAEVRGVDGIAAATPSIRQAVGLQPGKYNASTITVIGIDPATAGDVMPYPVNDGRFLTDEDTRFDGGGGRVPGEPGWTPAALLPVTTAEALGLGVGDEFEIPSAFGTTVLEVVGVLDVVATPGSEEVYVSLPAAQEMLGVPGRVSEIDAVFEPGVDRGEVEDSVASAVGDLYHVGAIDTTSSLFASLKMGEFIINMFGVFALAMAGFIILNTFRTIVAERRHDIGMLRAIGASRRGILGMFLVESVLQGVIGTTIGILAGWWLATAAISGLSGIYEDLLHLTVGKPLFTPGTWALAISMGIGITVLSALVPARAAARITPLEALRPQVGEVYEKAVTRRAIAGMALIVAAAAGLVSGNNGLVGVSAVVFLVGLALITPGLVKPVTDFFSRAIELAFRREGGLAKSNLQRNPGRAAVTASAMMVSVAVVIALLGTITSVFAGFTNYIDKSMGADFLAVPTNLLLSTGVVGADPQLVRELKATDGVGEVVTLRVGRAAMNGTNVQVIGIDPPAYSRVASFQFSEGSDQVDLARLDDDGTIMVNGIFAAQNGIAKGDTLTLTTPVGVRDYEVVAIGSDYLNAKLATTYLSQAALERDFGITSDVMLMANAEDGADTTAVFQSLKRLFAAYPAFTIYDTETWRVLQTQTFDQTMWAMYFLLVVLAAPSLLALINTLAMGVLARTREIGMLRAIGSTRRQVRRMVIAESLLLAALGTVLGMLGGVWLGYSMVEAMNGVGFPTPYYFPWDGLLIALGIGILFGVLAALIPARQATKLDIVQALHYE